MRHQPGFVFLFVAALLACVFALPANAQTLIVTRDVTVRATPESRSPRVHYPTAGDRLELLDEGRQVNGYYHVRVDDARIGWVYRSFVRREEAAGGAPSGPAPLVPATGQMAVHYINVDQGNAMLVEFPCAAILIDAGGRDPVASGKLTRYLDAFFTRRTDLQRRLAALYVTHTHLDHNTALGAVIYRYKIGAFIDNGRLNGSGEKDATWMAAYLRDVSLVIPRAIIHEAEVRAAGSQGLTSAVIDPIACPGVDPRIRVLTGARERTDDPSWSSDDFGNGNNHSVVIRIDFGDASFLFPGDLENKGIADMVARYAGTHMLRAGVMAVSHHGAENGTTVAFLGAVRPEIAVISMGPDSVRDEWTAWQYGHPREQAVRFLRGAVTGTRPAKEVTVATGMRTFVPLRLERAIYGTAWDGNVVVSADTQGRYGVATER